MNEKLKFCNLSISILLSEFFVVFLKTIIVKIVVIEIKEYVYFYLILRTYLSSGNHVNIRKFIDFVTYI